MPPPRVTLLEARDDKRLLRLQKQLAKQDLLIVRWKHLFVVIKRVKWAAGLTLKQD